MNPRIHKVTGFTLIELLVAIVVAALLFAWAIPSFQRFLNRATLNSETNNWVAALNLARNEAITRGEKVTICRAAGDPDACNGTAQCLCGTTATAPNYHTGYLIFTSTNNPVPGVIHFEPVLYGDELIRTGRTQSNKVTIQGNGFGNNAFSFSANGTLAPEDFGTGSARHILCVMSSAGNEATTISESGLPGRVVVIAPTGRPRVADFPGTGAQCVVGSGSSNTAADGLAN